MKRSKQGFIGTVQLGKRNKKTAQIQTVTLTPPTDSTGNFHQPTALEARHLAATYALHRVNSHMPMHRVLPPQHRDLWHQFENLKTKQTEWMYTPDPFNAQPNTPAVKKENAVDRRPTKESANAAVPMPRMLAMDKVDDHHQHRGGGGGAIDEKLRKYWESLPAVHMSSENRSLVEDVVKKSNIAYQPVSSASSIYSGRIWIANSMIRRLIENSRMRNVKPFMMVWCVWVSDHPMQMRHLNIAVIWLQHWIGYVSIQQRNHDDARVLIVLFV